MSDSRKYRYNPDPRLSANQLADYLTATPHGRKRIIRDAKFPTMAPIRYEDAREALRKHLTDSTRSHHVFSEALLQLARKMEQHGLSPWKRNNYQLCIEAITSFQRGENKLGVSKLMFRAANFTKPHLPIAGVDVSVAIDLIAHRASTSGNKSVGGVIFVFGKSENAEKAKKARCQAAAVLAYEFAKKHLHSYGEVDPKLCMAIDVFGPEACHAKPNQKVLLGKIEISCEEIAVRWASIAPPPDYDGPPVH